MAEEDELLTKKEAAERCKMHWTTLHKAMMAGSIEYLRVGGKVFITERARRAWFYSNVVPVTQTPGFRKVGRPSVAELAARAAASAAA
jgi:hypothetical protein